MKKNVKSVPEIRFPGFTDLWEERKLGNTVQITMGQSPNGGTYSDVPSDYILVQGNADLRNGWVFPRVWTSQMTKQADAGDLIMSVRAPAGAMGKTAYNVVIGRGVAAIKGNEFMYQLLVKMDSGGYWKTLSCGSTFESLNSNNIKNADVFIPDIAEQEKIGKYFCNLDNLITFQETQCKVLKDFKQCMLQKMFPKDGSDKPEIRFPGFTGSWEQRKVFEIADRFDNLRVPVAANLRIPGNTPYYGANGIQDYVEGYTHDGEYILVAEDGASDLKNYPVNYVNGRIWVNNHAHVLQGKEKIANNKFLSYAMCLADIESVLVGGGRAKLNADIMMNLDIAIPSFNEQEQIGAYFSNLDNLITLQERKCKVLRELKKCMLQKMFV